MPATWGRSITAHRKDSMDHGVDNMQHVFTFRSIINARCYDLNLQRLYHTSLENSFQFLSWRLPCACYLENDRNWLFTTTLFLTASLPGTATAHKLVVAIRQKCTPEDVLNELKDLPNPRETSENDMVESTFNPLKIDVFVQTLLNLGSKSFSHTFAAISKFHLVFKVSYVYELIRYKGLFIKHFI